MDRKSAIEKMTETTEEGRENIRLARQGLRRSRRNQTSRAPSPSRNQAVPQSTSATTTSGTRNITLSGYPRLSELDSQAVPPFCDSNTKLNYDPMQNWVKNVIMQKLQSRKSDDSISSAVSVPGTSSEIFDELACGPSEPRATRSTSASTVKTIFSPLTLEKLGIQTEPLVKPKRSSNKKAEDSSKKEEELRFEPNLRITRSRDIYRPATAPEPSATSPKARKSKDN